jgi:hypothetical protein
VRPPTLDLSERGFAERPWPGSDGRWWIIAPDGKLLRVARPAARHALADAVLANIGSAIDALLIEFELAEEDEAE